MIQKITILALFVSIYCCSTADSNEKDSAELIVPHDRPRPVQVFLLKRTGFAIEKIYNAKISAKIKAKPSFNSDGVIKSIKVKNGDRVHRNQIIAIQDTVKSKLNLELARNEFETAKLKLKDILIGQGYGNTNSSDIPEEVYSISLIKSGYNSAFLNFKLAKYNFNSCFLRTPVDGIIANINGSVHQSNNLSEEFCTIIEEEFFQAVFQIFETELSFINKSDRILIECQLYPEIRFEGKITEINPVINESGLVEVKSLITANNKNILIEGMNANVIVQEMVPKRLVLPKSSVMKRSGKDVVFTYNNGKANWNFVEVEFENLDSYTIKEGLEEGDTVIVSNNLNLSHNTNIYIETN